MQQEQYYKAVKASERKPPPEVELIFIPEEEAPVFGRFRTVGKTDYVILLDSSGEEEVYFYKDYVQWLEPIQLPDAQVLRDKMQVVLQQLEDDIALKKSFEQKAKDRNNEAAATMWRHKGDGLVSAVRLIREALSQTGDGWVRVEDGLPEKEEIENKLMEIFNICDNSRKDIREAVSYIKGLLINKKN